MQCKTCNGTGEVADPVIPKCGWCNDSGIVPRVIGDYMRACNLCDVGKEMRKLGYGLNPFLPATLTKEEVEKVLGPLTDDSYQCIIERYKYLREES